MVYTDIHIFPGSLKPLYSVATCADSKSAISRFMYEFTETWRLDESYKSLYNFDALLKAYHGIVWYQRLMRIYLCSTGIKSKDFVSTTVTIIPLTNRKLLKLSHNYVL